MITHKPMGEMCGLPSEYWTCSEVREPSRNSNTSYLNSKCTWAKTVLKKHLLQRLLQHVIKLTHIPGKLFLASEWSFPIGLPWVFPAVDSGKEPTWQCRRCGFDPWVRKSPWRRKWQPIPVLLFGKCHGWRSLVRLHSMGSQRAGHEWSTSLIRW